MTQIKNFYITYFAKTHNGKEYANGGKIITRKASEHNPKGTAGRMFSDMGGRLNKITKEALAARLMMENFGKELDESGKKADHTSKFLKELQKLIQQELERALFLQN